MAINYYQAVGDTSPGGAGFSMEGGRATEVYYIDARNTLDAIPDILGSVKRAADGTGRLKRKLPKAHPRYNFLFASEINDIRGRGYSDPGETISGQTASLVSALDSLEAPSITSQYFRQPVDQFTVSFQPRSYPVISDDQITSEATTWYDTDDSAQSSIVASEWLRYSEILYEPLPEWLTYQTGQMVFKTGNTASPHDKAFSAFPRILLPKAMIRWLWWQIPDSYLLSANSHLVNLIGRINQALFEDWGAGSLLYTGVRVIRRYTPPVPETRIIGSSTTFSTSKILDVELLFEETIRESPSPVTPSNRNWISSGHNLSPWLTRSFYYTEIKTSVTAEKTPLFLSAPFGLLFTDPDIAL